MLGRSNPVGIRLTLGRGASGRIARSCAALLIALVSLPISLAVPAAPPAPFTHMFEATAAEAASAVTVTTPDSQVGSGFYGSIKLDSAGNPVVIHYDIGTLHMRLLHCADFACKANATVLPIDVTSLGGLANSLQLDRQGRPVVSFHDGNRGDLRLLHCADANCSKGSGNVVTKVDDSGSVGQYTSLALDDTGRPVIAYYDGGNADLKLARCGDPDCSASNSINVVDKPGDVGRFVSMVLDRLNRPVIAYYDATGTALRLARCSDPTCLSGITYSVLDAANSGQAASLVLDNDGHPVVSYFDSTNKHLKILHCQTDACTQNEPPNLLIDSVEFGGFNSLQLDPAGNPVIAYYDSANSRLRILFCGNATCSAANVMRTLDRTGSTGLFPTLALSKTGMPVVAYYSATDNMLKIASCIVAKCNTPPLAEPDSATFAAGKPVAVNVLENDFDADSDSLTVTIVIPPKFGTAFVNADKTITYTPKPDTTSDIFRYGIDDGAGGTASATVTVIGPGGSPPEAALPPLPNGPPPATSGTATFSLTTDATTVAVSGGAGQDGGVSVVFSDGAVTEPMTAAVSQTKVAPTGIPSVNGVKLMARSLEITPSGTVRKAVHVLVNFSKADLGGAPLSKVLVAALTTAGLRFFPVVILDEAAGLVAVEVDHFTKFAFFTTTAPAPELRSPEIGAQLTDIGATLKWVNPPSTRWYHLQVVPFADDGPGIDLIQGDSAKVAQAEFVINAPSLGLGNYLMLPFMSYTWRVRTASTTEAPKAEDWSPWAVSAFSTGPVIIDSIQKLLPEDLAVVDSLTPTLVWANLDQRVFYYEVQVSKDREFGPNAFLYWELLHAGLSVPLDSYAVPKAFPLEPGTVYNWRVRPRVQGDGKPMSWSLIWQFKTPDAPVPAPALTPTPTATPAPRTS